MNTQKEIIKLVTTQFAKKIERAKNKGEYGRDMAGCLLLPHTPTYEDLEEFNVLCSRKPTNEEITQYKAAYQRELEKEDSRHTSGNNKR